MIQVADIKLIASEANVRGSCVKATGSSSSTGYYLDYIGTKDNNDAYWDFTVSKAKSVTITVNALSGDTRYLDIYIDDTKIVDDYSMNSGGGWGGSPKLFSIGTFSLSQGTHRLTVSKDRGTYAPLVDYVRLIVEADEYKYLIESDSKYYTIVDNELLLLDGDLTEDLFNTYGFNELNDSLILSLESPRLMTISDYDLNLELSRSGISKYNSILVKSISLVGTNSNGIKFIDYVGSDDILLSISFDNSVFFKYIDGNFVEVYDKYDGTSLNVISSISKQEWGSFCGDNTVAYIKVIFTSLEQQLINLSISI